MALAPVLFPPSFHRFDLHHGVFRIGRVHINVTADALYVPDAGVPATQAAQPPLPPERLQINRKKARKPKGRWTTSGYTTKPLPPDPNMVTSEANRLLASCEHILRNPGPRTRAAVRRGSTKEVVTEEGSVAERLRSKLTTALAGMCDAEAGRAAVEWLGLETSRPGAGSSRSMDAGEALLSDVRARLRTGPRAASAREQLDARYSSDAYRSQQGLPPRRPVPEPGLGARAWSGVQGGHGSAGLPPASRLATADFRPSSAAHSQSGRLAARSGVDDPSWATFDGFLQRSSAMRPGGRLMAWA